MMTDGAARTRLVSMLRSMVIICETLITEGFESPDSDLAIRTFPGASASDRFEVTTATITVAMRLSLNGFDWMISTGRRSPGPEPTGTGKEAHQSSPRFMTKNQSLRLGKRFVKTRGCVGVDRVKLGGNRNGSSGTQVRCESIRVELAPGKFELPRQMFAGLKHRIGNGDCDFHIERVSPKYDRRKSTPNSVFCAATHPVSPSAPGRGDNVIWRDIRERRRAGLAHDLLQFAREDIDHGFDARLPEGRESPGLRAA